MNIRWSKTKFYVLHIYYISRIFMDSSTNVFRQYYSKIFKTLNAFLNTTLEMPGGSKVETTKTIHGTFQFIGDLYGYSIVSPAFERQDLNRLTEMIAKSITHNKKVLFLDIGANVGIYSISLSNKIVTNKNFRIVAFEPDPVYFSLFKKNIRLNNVKNCDVYKIALGDVNTKITITREPKINNSKYNPKILFTIRTLDSMIKNSYYRSFDEVFIKIDVDGGNELKVLEGSKKLLHDCKKVIILLEDFVSPLTIYRYLQKNDFKFLEKNTLYNSFWEISL